MAEYGSAELIMEVGWRLRKEITRREYLADLAFAEDIRLTTGEWRGESRDGTPLTVTWVRSTRGEVLSAYEITGRAS